MNPCEDCALRLFNKHYNLKGIGNPFSGNLIIVPNVDYNASKKGDMSFSSQVEVIKDCLSSSTGELDNLYIVPLIRCNDLQCEVNDDIINKCKLYLSQDILKYNFKRILLLGESVKLVMNINIKDNINSVFVGCNRVWNVNYSPLVKYTNEDLFKHFKYFLNKWYNSTINNNYPYKQLLYF